MIISRLKICCFFLFVALVGSGTSSFANNKDRELSVVTYNMYLGTDFTEIFSSQSFPELVSEVAEAYGDVQSGNPAERIAAIADQIEAANPTLVGLQEVALWRTGEFGNSDVDATNVTYDFLQLLLDELENRGLHYKAAAILNGFNAELPGAGPNVFADVRYTDRDVILVRTDLDTSQFSLKETKAELFDNLLTLPLIFGNVTVKRGWVSADVKMRGKDYRFINAHTEAFHPLVQYAQADELMQGPANTSLPVILVGDFNSDAATGGASYLLMIGNGFSDAWTASNQAGQGFSWPLFTASANIFTEPTERLDLILSKGEVSTSNSYLLGEDDQVDVTPSGLRPSDHAGVAATLVLKP